MSGRKLIIRISVLIFITALFSLVMAAKLYELQVLKGDSYYKESENKITRTVEVPASRGNILDRYGRTLISNRLSYNVTFDTLILPKDRRNEIIYELISIAESYAYPCNSSLPVALTDEGIAYTGEAEDTANRRLAKFLSAMKWDSDISAEELLAKMRAEYAVAGEYGDADALKICAIRYELDLRSARIGLNLPEYVICEDVGTEFIAVVKERDLRGVQINIASVRSYDTDYAAHILGRVTAIYDKEYEALKEKGYQLDDMIGRDGVEAAFENWLRGTDGNRVEQLNSSGKVTDILSSTDATAGNDVVLTIDINLQEATEKALANRIQEIKQLGEEGSREGAADVSGGAVVAVDVNTGAILAMASYPTFSLETFNSDYAALLADPLTPMLNRALMGQYAPGSTFKMLTAAAALETGIITKETKILDKGIYMFYAPSYTPKCEIYLTSGRTHGLVNVVQALKVSCNYFFFEAGRLTGIEALNKYAKLFGLGSPTGVELAGEKAGNIAGPETRTAKGGTWWGGDTIQASIGQSDNLMTPLQLANYVATLVNGGHRLKLHLLQNVKEPEAGISVYEAGTTVEAELNLSEANVNTIKEGMRAVIESGSVSPLFKNFPIAAAGKTGTAQTGKGSAYGTFVCFAPYDNPEIAVAVIVEHAGKGSRIAAVARDVLEAYFRINASYDEITFENTLQD